MTRLLFLRQTVDGATHVQVTTAPESAVWVLTRESQPVTKHPRLLTNNGDLLLMLLGLEIQGSRYRFFGIL